MTETNKEITDYQNLVICLNEKEIINDFQSLLLCDIFYYSKFKGGYRLIKEYVYERYKDHGDKEVLDKDITSLINNNFIIKTIKKTIFNGKIITNTFLTLNKEIADVESITMFIDELNDECPF